MLLNKVHTLYENGTWDFNNDSYTLQEDAMATTNKLKAPEVLTWVSFETRVVVGDFKH